MGESVHMQWVEAQFANIQKTLIVVTTLLVIVGFIATIGNNWWGSSLAWNAAFFYKWVQCRLLERELIKIQFQLKES